MLNSVMVFSVKALSIITACAAMWSYLSFVSPREIEYATEQRDNSEHRVVQQNVTEIGKMFVRFRPNPKQGTFSSEWPCFRGAMRDNLSHENVPLDKTWDENGPRVLWRQTLGEGYAGAIIAQGCVYVLDYIEDEDSDALRCFELMTGEEIWRRSYKNPIRRNHGKSRTVPAYAENVVVTFGPAAHVMAVDATTGDLLWVCDLVQQYKCEVPQWYVGQCPLIDDGKVILGIGGEKTLMAALDLKTGETVWELPNDSGLQMSHASVLATELNNREQYVYAGIGGIVSCDRDGKPLWQCTAWKPAVWAPTPVKIAENRLFLTAGYGAGSALLTVNQRDDAFEAVIDDQWKPNKGPASEQQTPLVIDGKLFTIQPKDAGTLRTELTAGDIAHLPELQTVSGRQARFGLGPYLFADDAFWIADDDGVLHVYKYENNQFVHLVQHKVLPGVDSWGPIALAGGLMVLRDSTSMVCLDLRKEESP